MYDTVLRTWPYSWISILSDTETGEKCDRTGADFEISAHAYNETVSKV
jgi:hypothetical protein